MILALLKANWKLAAVLALCATCLALGWHWRGVEYEAAQADQLRQLASARRREEDAARNASQALQDKLSKLEASNRDLTRKLTHELQKPEYSCRLPDGGVQLRRDALGQAAE